MRAPVPSKRSTMSARSPLCRGPGLPGVGLLPLPDGRADSFELLRVEGDHRAARLTQPPGVADRVGRERASACCQGEHLTEDYLRALGRRRTVLGDLA
jgi:hypothetical protein